MENGRKLEPLEEVVLEVDGSHVRSLDPLVGIDPFVYVQVTST